MTISTRLRQYGGTLAAAVTTPKVLKHIADGVIGLAVGMVLWSLIDRFLYLAGFGSSANLLMVALAACCFLIPRGRLNLGSFATSACVAVLAVLGALAGPLGDVSATLQLSTLAAGFPIWVGELIVGAILLLPAFIAIRCWIGHRGVSTVIAAEAIAIGIGLNAFLFASWIGPFAAGCIGSIVLALAAASDVFISQEKMESDGSIEGPDRSPKANTDRVTVLALCTLAVGCGLMASACPIMLSQLFPWGPSYDAAIVAALFAAITCCALIVPRIDLSTRIAVGSLAIIVAAVTMSVGYYWLTDLHLDSNAFIQSVWTLTTIRITTVTIPFCLLGFGLAVSTYPMKSGHWSPIVAAIGFGLGTFLLTNGVASELLLLIGAAAACIACLATLLSTFKGVVSRSRVAVVGGAFALTGLIAFGGTYDPVRPASLLFNTSAFIGRNAGFETNLLSVIEGGRCLATIEEGGKVTTLWRQNGVQVRICENGVTQAIVSSEPRLCPHASAEVMKALYPLLIHGDPDSILLMGDRGGAAIATCAALPIAKVDYVVQDLRVWDEINAQVWDGELRPSSDDERVHEITGSARQVLAAKQPNYDVLIDDPGSSSLPQAIPHFDPTFYRLASNSLLPGGVFCQRFRQIDLGPEPLRDVLSALRSVFSQAAVVEIGPGEFALLASNRDEPLLGNELVDRLKRPHVREILATLGWDWSVPLNVTSFDSETIDRFISENDVAFGRQESGLAYRLPLEVMRWGAKWQELSGAIQSNGKALLAHCVSATDQRQVLDRLAAVTGQRSLPARYPDQPWAYRKELKGLMTSQRRSPIRRVAAEATAPDLHPEDLRRVEYLQALAAARANPTFESISQVMSAARPYDPMMTYFAHAEVSELYRHLGEDAVGLELQHLLHTIYFADSTDRSVRNALRAIEIAIDHPELFAGPTERCDHLDGLLQVLKRRWDNRGTSEPKASGVVLNDVETSLKQIDAALAVLSAHEPDEIGRDRQSVKARTRAIEKTLERPLESYRTRLLPHHRSQDEKDKEPKNENS
ncbi:spermidine synthase [Stratiformator vulcanicus]|uniref:Spermidine synthase n=1 Tax=Stratiformator vulcanicus TaxID=2527980 RepID=A0A517R366_9PLAN|nr:hypothetical protein [Stratiformator vulcanicus]QDT38277.1 spermidine synthase [Stratiformator vulcanicus]